MTSESTNKGYKIAVIVLSIVVAGLLTNIIFSQKKIVKYVTVIQDTQNQKDSLQNELQDMYISYSNLQTNNQSINDSLKIQRQKIEQLMQEMRSVNSNDKSKINQLKEEISVLKDIMKSYIHQIDSLYQQNQVLIVENTTIKKQYTQEIQKTQNLTTQNDSLSQSLQVAQELTAYNPTISTLNDREKVTNRIKKTKKFEVCFLLSENKVVSNGRKYIYLRVTKPDGEVLINDKSGYFNYEGKSIAFSSVKEIEYNGNSQNVCLFFLNPYEDLPAGKYTIFLFCDGKQIGDQYLELK